MKKLILLVFASIPLLFSCNNNDWDSLEDTEVTPSTNDAQFANDTALGSFLTNGEEMSLYFFSKDVKGASLCVDICADAWPLFYAKDLTSENGL